MRCCVAVEPDPFPAQKLAIRASVRTDRGCERQNNEDRAAFADLHHGLVFEPPAAVMMTCEAGAFAALVCDGMGGEEGGEIASRLAIETILPALAHTRAPLEVSLVLAIERASERIKEEGRVHRHLSRMGTTATLAVLTESEVICAQVGDSRAYLYRDGAVFQLTKDQTMAEYLRQSGLLRDSEIDAVVGPNVILQAVGSSTKLDVAITRAPLRASDKVLLCSDGLTGVVEDEEIAKLMVLDPEEATSKLIDAALRAGAPDNVTCCILALH